MEDHAKKSQELLKQKGFYTGAVDGDWGNASHTALMKALGVSATTPAAPATTGKIALTVTRFKQTKLSTTSQFELVAPGVNVKGFILEPSGPSTTTSGVNKRIPAGTYKLARHDGGKYKGVVNAYNSSVPRSRAILIHQGNTPDNTVGCLLVGSTQSIDFVGNSVTKLKELMDAIHKLGAENVPLVIVDAFV